MSVLYVFAGPNGAGKSTLSSSLVPEGTPIFDGDKEFALLKRSFTDTDSGTLYDAVNGHIFEEWKAKQLKTKAICAFETNFRSAQVMESVAQFKQSGYETHLLFFGLDSIEAAMERVAIRVSLGGHHVSPENIAANYTEGLKNFGIYYKEFDQVEVWQNFQYGEPTMIARPLLKIEKGNLTEKLEALPAWLTSILGGHNKRKGLGL